MRGLKPADYPGCPATVREAIAAGTVLRDTQWGLRDAAFALIGTFLVSAVLLFVLAATGPLPDGWYLIVGAVVPWLAMAGWPLFAALRYGNGARVDLGLSLRRFDLVWGIAGGLVSLGLGTLVADVTERIIGEFDSAAADAAEEVAAQGNRAPLIVFFFVVALGAPFAEELVFRGMLWAGLARLGLQPLLTLATTTIVFSLFHFEGSRIAVLLVVGGVFGYLRMRTQRLGASMVAHSVNNLPGAVALAIG